MLHTWSATNALISSSLQLEQCTISDKASSVIKSAAGRTSYFYVFLSPPPPLFLLKTLCPTDWLLLLFAPFCYCCCCYWGYFAGELELLFFASSSADACPLLSLTIVPSDGMAGFCFCFRSRSFIWRSILFLIWMAYCSWSLMLAISLLTARNCSLNYFSFCNCT